MGAYYRVTLYLLLAASAFAVGVTPVRGDVQRQDMPGKGGQPENESLLDILTGKKLYMSPEDRLLLTQQDWQHLQCQDTQQPEMKDKDLPPAASTAQAVGNNAYPGAISASPGDRFQSSGPSFQQNPAFGEEGNPQTVTLTDTETLPVDTIVTEPQPSFGDDWNSCTDQGLKSSGQSLILGREEEYLDDKAFKARSESQADDKFSWPPEATAVETRNSSSIDVFPIKDEWLQSGSLEEFANEQLSQKYLSEPTDEPGTSLAKISSTVEMSAVSESSSLTMKTTAIAPVDAGRVVTAAASQGCGDASFLVLCTTESSDVSDEYLRSPANNATALVDRAFSVTPTSSTYVQTFEAPVHGLHVVFFSECDIHGPAAKPRLLLSNGTKMDAAQETSWDAAHGNDMSSLLIFLQLAKGDRVLLSSGRIVCQERPDSIRRR